jgi:hypothetical protein
VWPWLEEVQDENITLNSKLEILEALEMDMASAEASLELQVETLTATVTKDRTSATKDREEFKTMLKVGTEAKMLATERSLLYSTVHAPLL